MKIDTLRMIVGFSIIGGHLISFAMVLLGSDFEPNERTELSLMISPVFAVYVTAIVRRFTSANSEYDSSPVHPAMRILSIGTSTIFSVAVPLVVFLYNAGRIAGFPELKATIGIIETALGIYTGAVVDRLFGTSHKDG